MLTKAILTGGVLALLSGSIVYFGTEGADALENDVRKDTRAEETELAGAAVAETEIIKTVDAQTEEASAENPRVIKSKAKKNQAKKAAADLDVDNEADGQVKTAAAGPIDPPAESEEPKPKTKWLDQYLKSSKSKKDKTTASSPGMEESSEEELEETKPIQANSLAIDAHEDGTFRYSDGTIVEDAVDLKHAREALEAVAGMDGPEVADKPIKRNEIRKKIVIKMDEEGAASWATDDEGIDIKMIEELLRDKKDGKKDIRILRMEDKTTKTAKSQKRTNKKIDYDRVLEEARKLQVVDMRNIAFFEIIDYAIDRKDFGQAADILQDLSDPELRDTARAKIGVGLARTGDSEAAFAVLDEMEIDELTASMRLEIITALMATKAERTAPALRR